MDKNEIFGKTFFSGWNMKKYSLMTYINMLFL